MSVNRRESVHSLLPEAAQENISMPLYQSRYPGKITPGQFEMGVRRAAARSSMGPPCCTSYPNPKNFLRHIKTAPQPSHNAPVTTHRRPKHKPPIPHGDQPHSHHTHKDYVTLNKQAVATIRKGSKSSTSCSYLFKKDFGRVPDYLVERQKAAQMAAREKESHRARQQQQALQSAGLEEMSPTQHTALLNHLKATWASTYATYQQLPLVLDTPSQRARKEQLEARLDMLDKHIEQLAQASVVLVAADV